MCSACDVLEASHNSADVIVSKVYDYGGENLGNGIRRLAEEMLNIGIQKGYKQGAIDIAPPAYNEGFGDGWRQGYETGNSKGVIKGSLITMGIVSLLGAVTYGANKLMKRYKLKKQENINNENSISEKKHNNVSELEE